MRKTYPSDLSDAEWTRLQPYLPTPQAEGRPRTHSLRDVLDAIFYVLKSGCHWRLLPHDFPPWSTVYYHFRRFRLNGLWHLPLKQLHAAERKRVGKDHQPPAATVDSLGLPLSVYVTSADVQDRVGARCLLAGLKPFVPRLKKIWADGAYTGEKLAGWCKERGGWELQIVERSSADTEGFAVLPHRWIVERTLGWLMRNRRLSKDYERKVQTSETFIEVAMIRLILRRLAREV